MTKVSLIWKGNNARVILTEERSGKSHLCADWRYVGREWIDGKVFPVENENEAIEWAKMMDVAHELAST